MINKQIANCGRYENILYPGEVRTIQIKRSKKQNKILFLFTINENINLHKTRIQHGLNSPLSPCNRLSPLYSNTISSKN